MVEENIGFRRIWHDGRDSYREEIHVRCRDDIVDGYEGWAIIDGKRHKVFYRGRGNTWATEKRRERWKKRDQ